MKKSWSELAKEVYSKKHKKFPCVVIDSEENKWCFIADDIGILMTGIYEKGSEPTARAFVKEHSVIFENAINNKKYLEEKEKEMKTNVGLHRFKLTTNK